MIKEEMLLYAIGELPEDMAAEEDMAAVRAGARQIEKEERRKKLTGISWCMGAAACIAVLAIFAGVIPQTGSIGKDSSIQPGGVHSSIDSSSDDKYAAYVEEREEKNEGDGKSPVSIFVKETEENPDFSCENKAMGSSSDNETVNMDRTYDINSISCSKTVELHPEEQGYIIFSLDADFRLTVSAEKSKTYTTGENMKKRYIKNGRASCRAGSRVYLDVNGAATALDVNIPEWEEQEICVIAYAETSQTGGGIFYIGKTDGSSGKNNKRGEAYYGIFIRES